MLSGGLDKAWGWLLYLHSVAATLHRKYTIAGKRIVPFPISPTFRLTEDQFRIFEIVRWRTTLDRRSSPTVQGVSRSGTVITDGMM